MKLVYWVSVCLNDSPCYSIRERTKKACAEKRVRFGARYFAIPKKVEIEYADGFDLAVILLGEGGSDHESS